jgi:ABC-type transporter Mla MlaB component
MAIERSFAIEASLRRKRSPQVALSIATYGRSARPEPHGMGCAFTAYRNDFQRQMCAEGLVMLRITWIEVDSSDSIQTLKLEGKLLGLWVDELSRVCGEPPVSPNSLRLDLAAVTFIDSSGVKLVNDLILQGATIVGSSGFIAELLSGRRA